MLPTTGNVLLMEQKMSLESFIDCDGGGFIDGSGNYMKDGLVSDISIYPSDIESGFNKKISIV
jgi:hypothetical protein